MTLIILYELYTYTQRKFAFINLTKDNIIMPYILSLYVNAEESKNVTFSRGWMAEFLVRLKGTSIHTFLMCPCFATLIKFIYYSSTNSMGAIK